MKDNLIKELIKANKRLVSALSLFNESVKIDRWTKKEFVSHIIGWYEEGVDSVDKILQGEKPNSFRYSINGFNRRNVEKRKSTILDELEVEMNRTHGEFTQKLKNLSEEELHNFYGTKLGKKDINLIWLINECIEHDNNHATELESLTK